MCYIHISTPHNRIYILYCKYVPPPSKKRGRDGERWVEGERKDKIGIEMCYIYVPTSHKNYKITYYIYVLMN